MSVSSHFTKTGAQLRMPKSLPGVPDANGFVFHGPVLTGTIDVGSALSLEAAKAYAETASPAFGGPLENDPVTNPLARRIPAPLYPPPLLDIATPSTPLRVLQPPVAPVPNSNHRAGSPVTNEAERVMDRIAGPFPSEPGRRR